MSSLGRDLVNFIQEIYGQGPIPLHLPTLDDRDKIAVADSIDTGFVSSAGPAIAEFEKGLADILEQAECLAVQSGTAALKLALIAAGVNHDDEVITQAFTFAATANVIKHLHAHPVFLDISHERLSLCPHAVKTFLKENCIITAGQCLNKKTGRTIKAIMPMHTYGLPAHMKELRIIADEWQLKLVEDAAEALGSSEFGNTPGQVGDIAAFSFNGNKIITTGGGGAITARNPETLARLRHISTTAKIPHAFEFWHDEIGYNYRMPNLNAALGLAQLAKFPDILSSKRKLAEAYRSFFDGRSEKFVTEPADCLSNYWLNTVIMPSRDERNKMLETLHQHEIFARAGWVNLTEMSPFKNEIRDDLTISAEISAKLISLPSTPPEL